jgi:hypothetical protein
VPEADPPDVPLEAPTAEDVKAALRRRHPGNDNGAMVGQWTCIEEWLGIDLLALNAWSKADVIGYEVKISRSDLRRELLKPHKRADALSRTTEFYFAVPAGLLTDDEIAYEEPEWEPDDFNRTECPGVPPFGQKHARHLSAPYGGRCRRAPSYDREYNRGQRVVRVPLPDIAMENTYPPHRDAHAVCWTCEGKGYLEKSRVEREAPTCWVPRDVGLVTISQRGCRVVKPSPKRKDPKPIATTRKHLNDLVRWVSHRPDPRHRARAAA